MNPAEFPYEKKTVSIYGLKMAYAEIGQGSPIVFLHGNPCSSYIWRNIMPYLEKLGRCIAPDLIGMGDSAKLPESGPASYTFIEHRHYLDKLFETLEVQQNVTFVVHDWGSALGFDWAMRHPKAIKGIAYMEAIVKPYTWDEYAEPARKLFQSLRSPLGEESILEKNSFIEFNLPAGIMRKLSEEEMNEYRRPFTKPGEDRRPTLTWPRQLPVDGDPADVTGIVTAYGEWLSHSEVPKLYIQGNPGRLQVSQHEFCKAWPNQNTVTVPGLHNLQEDSPDEIGQAIANWYKKL